MTEEHSSPIKTPKQLIIVVLLAFAVPITAAVLISQLVTSGGHGGSENENMVLSRIQPVGTRAAGRGHRAQGHADRRAGLRPGLQDVPRGGRGGRAQVRRQGGLGEGHGGGRQARLRACDQRHPRHAAQGRQQRPDGRRSEARRRVHGQQGRRRLVRPRGARGTDADRGGVRRCGGADRRCQCFAGTGRAAAPAASTAAAAAAGASHPAVDGKKIYEGGCVVCHGAGIAGAPKFGDKAAWAPRIKTGMDTLYATAIKGKGAMPPKGGNPALTDEQMKAAVDYMVAAAK